jgi:hypothetical protein
LDRDPVLAAFELYALYVVLPIIPAVLIFRLLPDTRVSVSGPFQKLKINASGAFAGYVVTALLGIFLVKIIVLQVIQNATPTTQNHLYDFEGTIEDLGKDDIIASDRMFVRQITDLSGKRQLDFVLLTTTPLTKPETLFVKYWRLDQPGGIGPMPAPITLQIRLDPTVTYPERFWLVMHNNEPFIERKEATEDNIFK